MKTTILPLIAALSLALASSFAQPAGSTSISFQGVLNGANSQPLPNGNYNLTFRFWDGPAPSGNPVCTNILVPNVPVSGGMASTVIPVDPAWFNGQTRYLGITVNGGAELTPRVLVTAVPYASYSHSTRGIAIDPPPAFDPPIVFPAPSRRTIIGTTTEDISRIPPANEALVIGTTNGDAGTTVGILFDTLSRTAGGITVEKRAGSNIEDHQMHFYVTSEGNPVSRECMTISGSVGNVGIGTTWPRNRLVVGTTDGDPDGMPSVDEGVTIGTTNCTAGACAGLYFDTNNRNGGGIVVEKVSGGSVEDHRMRFYLRNNEDAQSHNYMTIYENGVVEVPVLRIKGGADLAEHITVTEGSPTDEFKVEPGMVVSIDPTGNRKFKLSDQPYDRKRVGIISGGNGVKPGLILRDEGNPQADGDQPVALTGQVWAHADATFGAITPGDLLTTSVTPGHAMRVSDDAKARFAVLGQALTGLAGGRGWVQVLVGKQ